MIQCETSGYQQSHCHCVCSSADVGHCCGLSPVLTWSQATVMCVIQHIYYVITCVHPLQLTLTQEKLPGCCTCPETVSGVTLVSWCLPWSLWSLLGNVFRVHFSEICNSNILMFENFSIFLCKYADIA